MSDLTNAVFAALEDLQVTESSGRRHDPNENNSTTNSRTNKRPIDGPGNTRHPGNNRNGPRNQSNNRRSNNSSRTRSRTPNYRHEGPRPLLAAAQGNQRVNSGFKMYRADGGEETKYYNRDHRGNDGNHRGNNRDHRGNDGNHRRNNTDHRGHDNNRSRDNNRGPNNYIGHDINEYNRHGENSMNQPRRFSSNRNDAQRPLPNATHDAAIGGPLHPDFLKQSPLVKGYSANNVGNTNENDRRNQIGNHSKQNDGVRGIGNHQQKNSKNVQKSRLGYQRLEELSKQDPLQIAVELANSYNGFQYLLDEESFLKERPDWIVLISNLLAKVCGCEFPENKIKVLTYLCESKFIDLIVDYLLSLSSDTTPQKKRIKTLNTFLCDIIKIFETLTNIFPNNAKERFHDPVRKVFGHVSTIEAFTEVKVDDSLKTQLTTLAHRLVNMGSIAQTMNTKRDRYLDEGTPPEDFRIVELYPQEEEILQDKKVFLRRSIVDGGYENVEHYLDIQFRLLRQDLLSPLREGFKELIESLTVGEKRQKRINNLRLFKKCAFERIETKNDRAVYIVCFDVDRKMKRIIWEYNRWFMFGSLVFFSFDNFTSFFMGTVFDKNNKTIEKERTICVELIGDKELQVEEFGLDVMMVESTIFFQPYYHVMKALKQFDETNFPMSEYIVQVNPVIKPPVYLKNNSYLQIGDFPQFDILNEFAWPSPDKLGLDKYQYDAYKGALTREFVIMQGPPGTGKTYLGLRIIETFLKNEQIMDQLGSPILLVCYTNHALDQFLEGILKFTTSVVRVGSQSKSEIIKPYELGERRKCFRYAQGLNSAYITMREEIKNILTHIKTLETALNAANACGIVKWEFLIPYMSPSHQKQLRSSHDIVQWLLVRNSWDKTEDIVLKENEESDSEDEDEENNKEGEANNENAVEEDEFEEDEVRNQLRNEESLMADLVIEEEKMSLHILTKESLERQMRKLEKEKEIIERQEHLLNSKQYVKMRNNLETKWKQLVEGVKIIESQKNRLNKVFKIKDSTQMNNYILNCNMNERWNMYWNWFTNFKAEMMTTMKNTEATLRLVSDQYSEAKQLQDMQVLMNHKILGITTTAAAKNHLMLASLKPKIVVVEEAAEVLEAHIVTALTNHCEHLILIGDHQQLRPNPTVFELAKKYNLEISLFERMIKNKLTYSTLGVQHRMRPEISDLITPVIYPNLQNHTDVYNYPNVRGVTKNLFFVTHEEPESSDDNIQSYQNPHEGDFVLRLARYLLFQGYTPDHITILTTYSGQMIYLKMQKKMMPELREVRISTVDNYQGEECEIILLSLVRSNSENRIGFLSTPNRVCVALSRAKHGFYLIGNMTALEEGSQIWPNIRKQLEMHQGVGPALELQCLVHKNTTLVAKKADFLHVTEGGCSKMCNEPLQCGHSCKSLCHPTDREHKLYRCPDPCNKKCPNDHPCGNRCYEDCSLCRILVARNLPCGHEKHLHCYIDAASYPCHVKVEQLIELCGHQVQIQCHVVRSGEVIPCTKPCERRLPCGHACTRLCHVDDDPDHLEFKCMKPCEKKNAMCSLREVDVEDPENLAVNAKRKNTAGHFCKKLCHERCSPCNERVTKKLLCQHSQDVLCHLDVEFIECRERCNNTLPCNHPCRKRCIDPCGDCNEMVKKRIMDCDHVVEIKCRLYPERKYCKNSCARTLVCGHQCAKKCNEPCNDNACEILVECPTINSLCGHPTKVQCKDRHGSQQELIKLALEKCPEPCTDTLLCEHICQGSCSSCKQGRLHVMCKEKCGRVKICEHSCNVDCAALCPPCKLPCPTRCIHSKCPNPCGERCPPCTERCQWRCKHYACGKKCRDMCNRRRCYKPCRKKLPCEHECIGFCGEPCPPKCRICDKEEVTFLLFGTEDEEDARFVVLEDCGHFFESCGLETFLGITYQAEEQGKDKEILLPKCPQCKTPVINTLRFMNKTRQVMADIAQVKKKQNGRTKNVLQMKMEVTRRLKDLEKYPAKQEEKQKFLNSEYFINNIYYF